MDLIDSVFGIILLTSEVLPQGKLLLGLQDQNKIVPCSSNSAVVGV